ncbi:preprotein translocase subunit YajC [soil metagenome]
MPQLLLTLLLIGIGWYFLIRPLRARQRDQAALVAVIEVGDQVITAGGIYGVLTDVQDETVQIEVAPGIELTLARPAISRRIEPDTTIESSDNVTHDNQGPTMDGPS